MAKTFTRIVKYCNCSKRRGNSETNSRLKSNAEFKTAICQKKCFVSYKKASDMDTHHEEIS